MKSIIKLIPVHEQRILESYVRKVPLSRLELERSIRTLNEYEKLELKELIQQRIKGVPLQYLIESQAFWGREFYVNTSVFIPRPETEGLVELLLKNLPLKKNNTDFSFLNGLEFGTGSGCVAITISLERDNVFIHATECSLDALSVAKENAKRFNVHNVYFYLVSENLNIKEYEEYVSKNMDFDFIVSNPPYLSKNRDELGEGVQEYEPEIALFAPEEDLLKYYKFLAKIVSKRLRALGVAVFEIAENRSQEILSLFKEIENVEVSIHQDLAGRDRYLLLKKF